MSSVKDLLTSYSSLIDRVDLELILSHALKKSREYILTYPETPFSHNQKINTLKMIHRRQKHESIAHIVGEKDFYYLTFKVNKHTLIPRPETELLIDEALNYTVNQKNINAIIDIGTGSGNIIISIAHKLRNEKINYFGIDISKEALNIARHNAKKYNLDKKIKFIKGDLLSPLIKKTSSKFSNAIIIANLPYLSKEIYQATKPDVKSYEPKSALYSSQNGLAHYKKLFEQIKLPPLRNKIKFIFIEFSPEQKNALEILIKKILPLAQIRFKKDLAKKWRICAINLEK
ncbi:MAG: peptide chain release factor N(5)-glutamine methyltransferase [Candidatus Moraniibacteriota bacterium]